MVYWFSDHNQYQEIYVKLDFHDLIRNNIGTLKLHGKEQFVIDEFQQKIVGDVDV